MGRWIKNPEGPENLGVLGKKSLERTRPSLAHPRVKEDFNLTHRFAILVRDRKSVSEGMPRERQAAGFLSR
jgi:hypothetical protein